MDIILGIIVIVVIVVLRLNINIYNNCNFHQNR